MLKGKPRSAVRSLSPVNQQGDAWHQCSKESSEPSFRAGRVLVMLCHSHFGERSSYQPTRMNFKADHLQARDNGRSAQSNTSPVIVKQATLEKGVETGFFKSNSGIWNPH